MEQAIIIDHGMAAIIIHDQLPGDMEYIITLIPDGDSQLVLVLDGLDGASILTEELIGGQWDIIEDTGMDITGVIDTVTIGDIAEVQEQVMLQDQEIQTEMYIITDLTELNKLVMSGMHRHQIT